MGQAIFEITGILKLRLYHEITLGINKAPFAIQFNLGAAIFEIPGNLKLRLYHEITLGIHIAPFAIQFNLGQAIFEFASIIKLRLYHEITLGIDKAPFAIQLNPGATIFEIMGNPKLRLYHEITLGINKAPFVMQPNPGAAIFEIIGKLKLRLYHEITLSVNIAPFSFFVISSEFISRNIHFTFLLLRFTVRGGIIAHVGFHLGFGHAIRKFRSSFKCDVVQHFDPVVSGIHLYFEIDFILKCLLKRTHRAAGTAFPFLWSRSQRY